MLMNTKLIFVFMPTIVTHLLGLIDSYENCKYLNA